jgi:hypothetical protein
MVPVDVRFTPKSGHPVWYRLVLLGLDEVSIDRLFAQGLARFMQVNATGVQLEDKETTHDGAVTSRRGFRHRVLTFGIFGVPDRQPDRLDRRRT